MKTAFRLIFVSLICFVSGMIGHSMIAEHGSPEFGEAMGIALLASVTVPIVLITVCELSYWENEYSVAIRFAVALFCWMPTAAGMIVSWRVFGGMYPFVPSAYLLIATAIAIAVNALAYAIQVVSAEKIEGVQ